MRSAYPSIKHRPALRRITALMCALLIATANLWFATSPIEATNKKRAANQSKNKKLKKGRAKQSAVKRKLAPVTPPAEPVEGRESAEEIEGRNDWFLYQRMYPSNTIPADARRRAWESVSRIRAESLITPAAARGWRSIGPTSTLSHYPNNWGDTSGRVNAIAVSPSNSNIVLVGAATGGLWRSTDSGATFEPVADDQVDIAVGSITFSQSNPSIVYAAMGDTKVGYLGSGVLKSTNEGRTWSRVNNNTLPSPGTIAKIEVDRSDASRVYVAQYTRLDGERVTSSGVYISTDGGVNWNKTLVGGARDVVIDAGRSQTIYAGMMRVDRDNDPVAGLYRSTDRGSTWTNILPLQYELARRRDIKIAVSPANPLAIYVYAGGFFGGFEARLITSMNGGASWADRGTSEFDTAQFGYNTYIVADPTNANTVYIGSRDLYRSTDGGTSWTNLTRNFFPIAGIYEYYPEFSRSHPDQHAFAFVPGSANQFYIGNDGGVSKTTNGGATFQSLNTTLTLTQFVGISVHPTDSGLTVGGSQDNGTQLRSAGSGQWREFASGDGGRTVINAADPSIVFVTKNRGAILRYRDGGHTFDDQIAYDETFGEPTEGGRIAFYAPFCGNGVDHTLYFATWRLFTSIDLGASWNALAGDMDFTKGISERGRDVINAIGVGRADTRVIYTGSVQGRAMRTTDGGATWTDVIKGLPDRAITSVAVHPVNSAIAYLSVSGFKTGHVFKTTDYGVTWTDASSGLPDIPTNALLFDPVTPDTIYAGTDVGVFRSTAGASWEGFNKGLPPVVVTGFAAQPGGLIQAATYGRGAYEFAGVVRPSIASVTFNGKKLLTIQGGGFDESSRVIVNGVEKTDRITSVSDTTITVGGKQKKIGLKAGDNTVQVIGSDNIASNVVTLKL